MAEDLSDMQAVGGSIPPPSTEAVVTALQPTFQAGLGPDDVDYHFGYDRPLLGLRVRHPDDVSNSP